MTDKTAVPDTDEAWESGDLGTDKSHAQVETGDHAFETQIDESLDLQMISIRLHKTVIEDFKLIAQVNGMGYQPLMRQVLARFADSETRRLLGMMVSEQQAVRQAAKAEQEAKPAPKRRVA